ncbi:MAG: hypothetical protein Q4F83_14080 [Eubacteriales bacterium]|nr:hypothetical protein [Eubacteriales bacterium]
MVHRILIVEDDKKLNDGISLALKGDGRQFFQCRTLRDARQTLQKNNIS